MNRLEQAAAFGRMMGKVAGDTIAPPGIDGLNRAQMLKDPSQRSWGALANPAAHSKAHPGPMMDGPSWVNGQIDKRIPGSKQRNVVESSPAALHRGSMYPSPAQNQKNLAQTTTQYGSFPGK